MRLLLVEDDQLLGDGLKAGLGQEGYAVDWVSDGESASAALATDDFDLMVLDLGLPDRSGLSVLKELRNRGTSLPVLILTARDTVADRIKGLDAGADDYLVKPFDLEELAARLRAIARRRGGRAVPLLANGEIALDPASRQATRAGVPVELSPREFALLRLFLENCGRALAKTRLEESLYGWGGDVESNTVEVYVHHLRKKFGKECIRTIRGVGYLMDEK